MSRILGLVVSALLLAGAWVLESPASLDPDPALLTGAAEEDDVAATSRFSHCPWAYADGDIDTTFALASLVDVEFRLSFPAGGELDVGDAEPLGTEAAVAVPLSASRVQGDAPAIIEFTDGPAAAGIVAHGDTELAAATCPSSLPKVWSLPGGTTATGTEYILRLLNPFADDARVSIRANSELGSEALPGFETISVPARAARTILLHDEIPGRTNVALSIEQLEGSVIPMAEVGDGTDIAVWPATRQSETWELPLTQIPGTTAELALANDALIEVTYTLDVFGEDGTVEEGPGGVLPGPGTVSIPLDGLAGEGAFGIRVSADGPVSAAVGFLGEGARALAAGQPTVSARWLVPGPNADPTARYRLWMMNSGVEPVTVTYRFLDSVGDSPEVFEEVLGATSMASFPAVDIGSAAILVEASAPISVVYSAELMDAHAVGEAVPIGE